jgi:tetratricopeptide (TPR) repeat protein
MKKILAGLIVVVLLGGGAALWWWLSESATAPAVAAAEAVPPRDLAALETLGEGLEAQLQRRPEEALEKFGKALEADATLPGVRYQMAVAAYQAGDNEAAKNYAGEAIAAGENTADAQILLGTMAARDGDHATAAAAFGAAVAADPANAMAYYNWSESLRHNGKAEEALEKLRMALTRNPGEPLYALKQRLARIEAGDDVAGLTEEARAQVNLDPPAGDWLLTAAAIDLANGDSASAARMLEGARVNMQPILFVGVLQEDPFFRRYKDDPAVAPFLDVTIEVKAEGKKSDE